MQSSDNLELAFKHELCSYPFALFDFSLKLHEADKPALDDVILKICEHGPPVHRVYVVRKYKDAIVAFDGYENMNTTYMTHQRQSNGKASTTAANMTMHHSEEGQVFGQPNEHEAFFLLSAELKKNG